MNINIAVENPGAVSDKSLQSEPGSNKKLYGPPVLTVYGSVRQLTGNGQGSGNDAMSGIGMAMTSDARCKTDIVKIGVHSAGFGLYLFRYRPEFNTLPRRIRHFGVLAQEVEAVFPQAVSMDPNGFKRVNYTALGIHLA
jgi:hypothetical protein